LAPTKKNDRSDPKRSHPRSRPTVACRLQLLPPVGPPRSGSCRDGRALRHAPSGRGGAQPTAALSTPARRSAHFHLIFHRHPFRQRPVEPCPADLGQVTHPLDTQAALHRHHFPDLVVDALAPESVFCWRRAATFCKAPLKKSTSSPLSASARLSWLFSWRSSASRGSSACLGPPAVTSDWEAGSLTCSRFSIKRSAPAR